MRRHIGIGVLAAVLFAVSALAQSILNNDSVVKMAKAGLGDDVIVSMIKGQPGSYAVDPDSVIQLKSAGLSEKVIAAMIAKHSANSAPSPTPTAAAAEASPDYPLKAHVVSLVHPKDGPIPGPPLKCSPPRLGETKIQIGDTLYTVECREKGVEVGQDYPAKVYEKTVILLIDGKDKSFRVRDKEQTAKQ